MLRIKKRRSSLGKKRKRKPAKKLKKNRRSKFTPETTAKILEAVSGGSYFNQAAKYAGISRQTLHNWIEKGEQYSAGLYHDFYEKIIEAEAKAEVNAVKSILEAGRDTWQALAWYLERKHPERWAKRERDLDDPENRTEEDLLEAVKEDAAILGFDINTLENPLGEVAEK